jgi:ribonuclease HII
MSLHIGIDEVGYGPILGPLVVTSVKTRFFKPINFWRLFNFIKVCDSKRLYHGRQDFPDLEFSALSFLQALSTSGLPNYRQLMQRFVLPEFIPDLARYPWYQRDLRLPLETRGSAIKASSRHITWVLRQLDLSLDVRVVLVESTEINRGINATGNKAEYLWKLCKRLILLALSSGDSYITIEVGRLGGRKFYLQHLLPLFADSAIWVMEEREERSIYQITSNSRMIELRFLKDAEDHSFHVALSSIIGKYFRELSMKLWNRYWSHLVPQIAPTSGYAKDAKRFLADIKHLLGKEPFKTSDLMRVK